MYILSLDTVSETVRFFCGEIEKHCTVAMPPLFLYSALPEL